MMPLAWCMEAVDFTDKPLLRRFLEEKKREGEIIHNYFIYDIIHYTIHNKI
jgi:hypothetical protein